MNAYLYKPRGMRGFSLVELMVVVAVLTILLTLAYPSYQQTLIDQRRSDVQNSLLSFVSAMERFRSDNSTYAGAEAGTGFPSAPKATVFPSQAPVDGDDKYYNLTIENANGAGYVLRATPINGTSQAGTGFLEITSSGQHRWDKNDDNAIIGSAENTWKDD